ncbi:hypothetical protein GJ496_011786 [Pomphorhynchus laevis]|nr:hypothetical protein GJ496_011786 [Pomphorhynchus laevis]
MTSKIGDDMVASILDAISRIGKTHMQRDDDMIDKVNRRYSFIILLLFTVIVSTKQYVGDPIACWTPAQFTGAHVEYANCICWVSNSYYINQNVIESSQEQQETDKRNIIPYYQWVPLILPALAFCFYAPGAYWQSFLRHKGFDMSAIARSIDSIDEMNDDSKDLITLQAVKHFDRAIKVIRQTADNCPNRIMKFNAGVSPNYKCIDKIIGILKFLQPNIYSSQNCYQIYKRYLSIKLVYIMNNAVQLYLLKFVIGESYTSLGSDLLNNVIKGEEWKINENFPRVTLCDFTVRNLADNNHRHTIQCVLPVNIFNEKIFIFLWFWYSLIIILNLVSISRYILYLSPFKRQQFVKKHLDISDCGQVELEQLRCFINSYLSHDGVLLLRILSNNINSIKSSLFIQSLWDNFSMDAKENNVAEIV